MTKQSYHRIDSKTPYNIFISYLTYEILNYSHCSDNSNICQSDFDTSIFAATLITIRVVL